MHIALVPRLRCQQPWHNNRSWICDCSTFRQLDRLASLLVVIVDAVGCFDPAFDSTECCLTQHGTIDRSIAGVFVNGRLQSSNAMPISHRHQLSTMLRLVCSAGGLCAAGAAHSVGHRLALSRLGEQAGAALHGWAHVSWRVIAPFSLLAPVIWPVWDCQEQRMSDMPAGCCSCNS
ncbi:hypothetical protein COO60DRAFT_238256 [Scenedesmus sp. NREL 46B-D3]|nr:hypothetical protein COO60DRAFT_238256 [Scenedesmus sp. NREL 46B-D3]